MVNFAENCEVTKEGKYFREMIMHVIWGLIVLENRCQKDKLEFSRRFHPISSTTKTPTIVRPHFCYQQWKRSKHHSIHLLTYLKSLKVCPNPNEGFMQKFTTLGFNQPKSSTSQNYFIKHKEMSGSILLVILCREQYDRVISYDVQTSSNNLTKMHRVEYSWSSILIR